MFPIGRKMIIHLLESWASAHPIGKKKSLFPHPFHWALLVEHDIIWYGISLCQCGSSAPAVSPPSPWCTPSLGFDWMCIRRAGQSGRHSPYAQLGNSQSLGVVSALLWPLSQSTAPYGLQWGKFTPSQTQYPLTKGLINPLLARQDIIYIEGWVILKDLFAIPFWFQDIYKCQILFVGTNPVVHWDVSDR